MARDEDIDAAVLSSLTVHWQKVAMVAVKTMERLSVPVTDGEMFDKVCGRVESLVQLGKITARGNVSVPTRSEVRMNGGGA